MPGELERSQEEVHSPAGSNDNQKLYEKQGDGVEIRFMVPAPKNARGDDHVWREADHREICRVVCRW